MNNGNNPKLVGMELLKRVQILYQNEAISTEEKNNITFCIKEGMTSGTFYKLNQQLLELIDHPQISNMAKEMLEISC